MDAHLKQKGNWSTFEYTMAAPAKDAMNSKTKDSSLSLKKGGK